MKRGYPPALYPPRHSSPSVQSRPVASRPEWHSRRLVRTRSFQPNRRRQETDPQFHPVQSTSACQSGSSDPSTRQVSQPSPEPWAPDLPTQWALGVGVLRRPVNDLPFRFFCCDKGPVLAALFEPRVLHLSAPMAVLCNRFDECRGDFARLSVRTDNQAGVSGWLVTLQLAVESVRFQT